MSKEKREYGAAKLRLCRDIADNPDASPALKMARLGELWNFARNYLPLDAERAVFELSTYRLAYSILHSPYGHLLPSPLHECLNDRRLFFGGGLFVYASIVPADFHAACNVIASALHNGTASKDDIGDKLADIGARQAATADAVDALRAQTTAEHREQGATLADTRDRLPPVLAKAAEVDRHETNLARTFQKATAEWGLTERQKRILALHVQDKTAKAIGQDKEVRLKERQVRYELATINAVFLQKTGQSLSSRKRATREEVAEGAPWTGNVTQPDTLDDGADPDNLDRDDRDDGDRDE